VAKVQTYFLSENWNFREVILAAGAACPILLSQVQGERWESKTFNFRCPTVASFSRMSRGERARANDFSSAQRLVRESSYDGSAEFCQAQGGAAQRTLARPFFHKFAILKHSYGEPR
jgi:hypothetical protein